MNTFYENDSGYERSSISSLSMNGSSSTLNGSGSDSGLSDCEIDRLTASVRLDNGVKTRPVEVDLTSTATGKQQQRVPSEWYNHSFCDGSISVSTYVEKKPEVPKHDFGGDKNIVSVKPLRGEKFTCRIPPDAYYVQDLKKCISEKSSFQENEYRLGYGNKELEVGRRLDSYKFERNPTVYMMENPKCNRGG